MKSFMIVTNVCDAFQGYTDRNNHLNAKWKSQNCSNFLRRRFIIFLNGGNWVNSDPQILDTEISERNIFRHWKRNIWSIKYRKREWKRMYDQIMHGVSKDPVPLSND